MSRSVAKPSIKDSETGMLKKDRKYVIHLFVAQRHANL